jgi:hypothetical protein
MADKKINQLDPYDGTLAPDDLFVINQDPATGKAVSIPAADVRASFLGGTTDGQQTSFLPSVPPNDYGNDGDVVFVTGLQRIYQKASGAWVLRDTYGLNGGVDQIKFTAIYGTNGLSSDGKTYTDSDLLGAIVQEVRVEADSLIRVDDTGDVPEFDEFDFSFETGQVFFGSPLPPGLRITVIYSL